MSRDLVRIKLSEGSSTLAARLGKLDPSLGKLVETVGKNAIHASTGLALKSYKSIIPIDTRALRNTFLKAKDGLVFIDDGQHTNSRGKTQPATKLADILQKGVNKRGDLHRSQDSQSVDPFGYEPYRGEIGGWEDRACKNFTDRLGKFLEETDFVRYVS